MILSLKKWFINIIYKKYINKKRNQNDLLNKNKKDKNLEKKFILIILLADTKR